MKATFSLVRKGNRAIAPVHHDSAIGISDNFWSPHIRQPSQPAAILFRVEAETDIAVTAWPATAKEGSHHKLCGNTCVALERPR